MWEWRPTLYIAPVPERLQVSPLRRGTQAKEQELKSQRKLYAPTCRVRESSLLRIVRSEDEGRSNCCESTDSLFGDLYRAVFLVFNIACAIPQRHSRDRDRSERVDNQQC